MFQGVFKLFGEPEYARMGSSQYFGQNYITTTALEMVNKEK